VIEHSPPGGSETGEGGDVCDVIVHPPWERRHLAGSGGRLLAARAGWKPALPEGEWFQERGFEEGG